MGQKSDYIRDFFGNIENKLLKQYLETPFYEKKKAGLLLRVNILFSVLFSFVVLPLHMSEKVIKPMLPLGDLVIVFGMFISLGLLYVGRLTSAGTVSSVALFAGPILHNVVGDYLNPSQITSMRYFETLIIICFILPIITNFSVNRRHIILGGTLSGVMLLGHLWVINQYSDSVLAWTFLVYLVIPMITSVMGLANLRIVNEAIGTLIIAKNRVLEWNQILEDQVQQRTQELTASNQQLEALSGTDALTGIANRRRFDTQLQEEWNRAKRNQQPLTVMIVDLDQFKLYNDTFGHHQGDLCLISVARQINGCVQRAGELAARFGGEEFVVLMPSVNDKEAFSEGERIRHAVGNLKIPHAAGATHPYVTVSIGIHSAVPKESDSEVLFFEQADEALYVAKSSGRNCVRLFSQDFDPTVLSGEI